jgi:hypothetical protein
MGARNYSLRSTLLRMRRPPAVGRLSGSNTKLQSVSWRKIDVA